MKLSIKKLSFVAAIITAIFLIYAIVSASESVLMLIVGIIVAAFEGILAYAMYREKNDKFTKIVVILYAIFNANIYIAAIIVMMLIKKKAQNGNAVSKYWWVPGAVGGVVSIIEIIIILINGSNGIDILYILAGAVNIVILGYWLVNDLDISNKYEQQVKFFNELLESGKITQQEYDEKIKEINS